MFILAGIPFIDGLLTDIRAVNEWSVHVKLLPGVDPHAVADTLMIWDTLLLHPTNLTRVPPLRPGTILEPPTLFLWCPPSVIPEYVIDQVKAATPVTRYQRLSRPGLVLLTLQHTFAAQVLAGYRGFIGNVGTIILTSGSSVQD